MCTTIQPTNPAVLQGDLGQRLVDSTVRTLELYSIHLGVRLGLYAALVEHGPLTPAELASHAGIAERYAREWLEQQSVAGFLAPDHEDADPTRRRYLLPESNAAALTDEESLAYLAPMASMVVGVGGALPEVVEAYRTGGGVPYARYGQSFRDGQGAINRPLLSTELTGSWLPSIPDVHARLLEGGARVADVGCGQGWSTIALAEAYPSAEVIGIEPDQASAGDARERAAGLGSKARFEAVNGKELAGRGPFDVVLIVEALHDMSHPDEVLRGIRESLAPGGALIVVDERVADEFSPMAGDAERMMYGWSVVHCLPVGMAEQRARPIGTVIRSSAVKALAEETGYARFEILPIEHEQFRFYRLGA
ncbi:MAG: methyltransferase domain-containing protein [bacterium]|nr:methyltransferase domain-containing protein [bacterium]